MFNDKVMNITRIRRAADGSTEQARSASTDRRVM